MFKLSIVILVLLIGGNLFSKEKQSAIQERSLIIKDGLFYPDTLHLFEGEALHLMVGNFIATALVWLMKNQVSL